MGSCTENEQKADGSGNTANGGGASGDSSSAAQSQSPIDEPRQLIEFIRNDDNNGSTSTTIKLQEDTINSIAEKAGNRPVSAICICGPSRQGKSFILGYMIRCLESLENDETDWMEWDNKFKPLEGFKFRNGTKPETQGIWIWSRPFIIKNEEEKEVAVLLIDTQGTCDEFTTNKDMSAIVGLSLLTSSVMIFNCFTNVQEDILTAMNTYTHYGQLALDNSSDTPFQKLIFLVRDWNNPGEFPYGSKGGKKFIDEKLKVKSGQPPEARQVRDSIQKCFKELDCFLMPGIGEKALYEGFTGSLAELSNSFARNMEQFINNLIGSETLVTKEILGGVVTVAELKSYLENYLQVFNSKEVPSASSMWEATSDVHNNHVVKKGVQKFTDLMKKKLRGSNYLLPGELEKAQKAAEKQAHDLFQKARKFGSEEKISEYQEQLEQKLTKEWLDIKRQNEEKRNKFLAGVTSDATTQFRNLLEETVSFDDDDPNFFYEDKEISRAATQAKDTVVAEIREKLDKESEETINSKIQSLEDILEVTLQSQVNRNRAQRADAEKKMTTISDTLCIQFEDQLKDFLHENEFAECEELQKFKESVVASSLTSWKKAKKPGKKEFQKHFLDKLEKEFGTISSRLENEHKLKLNQCQRDAEDQFKKICNDHESLLTEKAETVEMEEELEQIHKQLLKETLQNFRQDGNPYPEGHSLHKDANARLEASLESIFERVQREVVNLQQRCEESYREAMNHAFKFYDDEMKAILNSSELISDTDLEVEHNQVYNEALQEFEDFEKFGVHDNELNFKHDLKQRLRKQYDAIKSANDQKRQLVHSRAKNCVNDCHSRYQNVMKDMDKVRTDEQLLALHLEATKKAKELFAEKCPGKEDPEFVKPYEEELDGEIEDTYEELRDLLEMKRRDEEAATKVMLVDCRKYYHDEMQKHSKNTHFIRPDQLDQHHAQAKAVVMDKCIKQSPLSSFQKMDLETEIDKLYQKYTMENDMKLNSGSGVPPAIGIDLGTTYCCVAVYINGKVVIIPNQEQGNIETTASYVAYNTDGSTTIGDVAKQNAFKNPENTIYDAKRILGRKMTDAELQRDMTFWPFEVQEEDGVPKININGKLYFPEQISAEILSELRSMAEKHMGLPLGTITKAVITVPAYFNDGQRQATVDAGELAGLEVLTILNEPTAAAIAYSMERFDTSATKVLVYDLGGGTFDVAVLDVAPGSITVLGVDGDTHLGGEDFDQKMMEYCAEEFKAAGGIDLFDGKDSSVKQERDDARRRLRRLQTYCETAKKYLASAMKTTVSIDAIHGGVDLMVEVTRDKFEELNEPLFKKTIDIVEKALKDTGIRKEEIDDVVLVGGSTRILKVREMLSDFFNGKALNYSIHADQAVAYGAAVKAAMMNGEQTKGEIDFDKIEDVTPLPLGIEDASNKALSVIIPKNTKIPTKRKEVFRTCKDNQKACDIKIYQGEDYIAANNELLGKFILEGVPPGKAGKECIDVIMEMDSMGILHVEAVIKSTKGTNKITVRENRFRMSAETKSRLLAEAEANPAA